MLLLSCTRHFHSCRLTTQAKDELTFTRNQWMLLRQKTIRKICFLFPESNVAEASVLKVSIFKIVNKIPRCDHRDIHFTACSNKVVIICPVFWLSEILVSWNQCETQKPHMWGLKINRARLLPSKERVNKSTTRYIDKPREPLHKSHARKKPAVKYDFFFFQFSGINITHIYSVQTVFFFIRSIHL